MPLPGEAETILPTAGQLRDEALLVKICRVHKAGYVVYGARRVRLQLNREGIPVACCTVERLMVAAGLVHHWDRGVQYASITLSERFTETGIAASVGAVGSCWDNALTSNPVNAVISTIFAQTSSEAVCDTYHQVTASMENSFAGLRHCIVAW